MTTVFIPRGYCQCGCGEQTRVPQKNNAHFGWVKGEPLKFVRGHNGRRSNVHVVEEDHGHATACWVWQGAKSAGGYGRLNRDGHQMAHRWYFENARGPIPAGMVLDHLCQNRACVNPDHLEVVTPTENTRRGRATSLTPQQVDEIRTSPLGSADLARRFSVGRDTINDIRARRTWR